MATAKAALAFDHASDAAFWLIHSVPLLPMNAAFVYRPGELKKAQTLLKGKISAPTENGEQHPVENTSNVNLAALNFPYAWSESVDHAKLAISDRSNPSTTERWVCVGDINFTDAQDAQGGGTCAFVCPSLWSALVSVLVEGTPRDEAKASGLAAEPATKKPAAPAKPTPKPPAAKQAAPTKPAITQPVAKVTAVKAPANKVAAKKLASVTKVASKKAAPVKAAAKQPAAKQVVVKKVAAKKAAPARR